MTEEEKAWFDQVRESLQTTIKDTEEIFERQIIAIASGGIAVSVGFVTALSEKINYQYWWIIAIGWACFTACIILNLLSHLESKRYSRMHIDAIDRCIERFNHESQSESESALIYQEQMHIIQQINEYNRLLEIRYNKPSATLLVSGIIIVLLFALINIINTNDNHPIIMRQTSNIQTVSYSISKENGVTVIQQDTLNRYQIIEK